MLKQKQVAGGKANQHAAPKVQQKPKPKPAPAVAKAAAPVKKETPATAPAKKAEAADEPAGNYIAYETLKARNFDRSKIDIKALEQYLSPTEFQKIFNMSKEQFNKLKGWKRVQLKKRNKLF